MIREVQKPQCTGSGQITHLSEVWVWILTGIGTQVTQHNTKVLQEVMKTWCIVAWSKLYSEPDIGIGYLQK